MITRFDNHDVLGSGDFSTESGGFNLLPLDMIRHIFLMIFKDKDHFNVFSYASQVSKRFYFLLDWSNIIFSSSIASQLPFERYHFIAAIRKGRSYSVQNLEQVLKKKKNAAIPAKSSANCKEELTKKSLDSSREAEIVHKSEGRAQVEYVKLNHPDDVACPFVTAIDAGQIEIFKKLFEKQSFDFDIKEIFKIAVKKGSLDVLKFLEKNHYSISDIKNPLFIEALRSLAVQSQNIKMVEKFLPKDDPALNHPQHYFRYLENAISQFKKDPGTKQREIIQYLFTNKGSEIIPINNGHILINNSFVSAMKSGDQDLSLLVWNSGLFPFNEDYFWQACKYGHHQLIALFLKLPECVLIRDTWEYIHLAMKKKQLKVIKNCLKSPKMMISPLIKESLQLIKELAQSALLYSGCFLIGGVLFSALDIATRGITDLTTVKIVAACTIACVITASLLLIAIAIIFVLGSLLFLLCRTAHALGFLAYHQIKMRLLA